jgi:putative addiction module component (TIGR02574 family)
MEFLGAAEDRYHGTCIGSIEEDIIALSDKERAELLGKLIAGLNAPADAGSDAAWLKESERRLDEIEAGTARTFPADDVVKEARARLK